MNKKKIVLGILIFIAAALVLQVFLVPVGLDAGGCSGGFKTHISSKYAYEFGVMFIQEHNFNELQSYNYNNYTPPVDELARNMSWKGRTIYTSATIGLDGVDYSVQYEGKRYWFESYRWKITDIQEITEDEE
ncbi:MAG: hypothetical protein GXY17_03260 [Clostridiaceae bacterium]|jgi:hypothetical protein|nr:hypothetical protein [Clostridiaceae bacterium]